MATQTSKKRKVWTRLNPAISYIRKYFLAKYLFSNFSPYISVRGNDESRTSVGGILPPLLKVIL